MANRWRQPLVWLVRLVVAGSFRGYEIVGREKLVAGPKLVVCNHFGGLVDPIVAIWALGGMPNIVAKSTLFSRLPLRLLLRALGVIPVYRSTDVGDTSQNVSSFTAVHQALQRGCSVLIFPEGTVTDEQRLLPIRTGAARMVLGAKAAGIEGVTIVPLGITYEDKVSARSRVLVEIGEPISIDEVAPRVAGGGPIAEENHAAVDVLTGIIADRLQKVSPDYGSLVREAEMMKLANVYLRTGWTDPFRDPDVADLRTVAQALAHVPEETADPVIDQVGRYILAVEAAGLSDDAITPRPGLGDLAKLMLRSTLILLLVSPLVLFGLVANLVPLIAVLVVGSVVAEPVTKGTARIIAAVVLFPVSWAILIWATNIRGWGIVAAGVALAAASVAVVASLQLVIELAEAILRWRQVRGRRALLDDLEQRRSAAERALADLVNATGVRRSLLAADDLGPLT